MKIRDIIYMAFIAIIIAVGSFYGSKERKTREQLEQARADLAKVQEGPVLKRGTIRDSVPVTTSSVVPLERRTYRKEIADKKLLKDLGLKPAQIESQQKSGTIVGDTVRIQRKHQGVYEYSDRWARFHLSMQPPDTILTYSVRDSLVTLVYREYKHHFLWWKWGTKGYKVKIVNFNPHGQILYNQYVKMEE
ncbi:MAG: hypothetical protein PUF37_05430 [Prevotellaceae bacterium]|nr:hypothetical protein [Prevotellaceae bacterium]